MQNAEVVHHSVSLSRFAPAWRTLLVLSSLLTCCIPAMAGYYVAMPSPNPTGGAISPSGNFYPNQGNSYSGVGGHSVGAGATASAQITDGELVKKYQWVSDPIDPYDTYPKKVVVTMSCTVTTTSSTVGGPRTSASTSLPTPSASASNGLGDPGTPMSYPGVNSSGVPYVTTQASSSGVHTIIMDGDDELEVKCTVSGSGSATAISDYGAAAGVDINVGWTVISVEPIQLNLAPKYVISQLCSASLSPGGLTPISYSWSVSGGEPFADYSAGNVAATFTPLGTLTNATTDFYWKKPSFGGPVTVTCTSQVLLPDLTVQTVTAEKKCDVEKPDNSLSAYMGTVQIGAHPVYPLSGATGIGLVGASALDQNGDPITYNGYPYGIIWIGDADTPYSSVDGTWNFTQLVTPNRSHVDTSAVSHTWQVSGTSPFLDGPFPYASFTADGAQKHAGDGPWETFAGRTQVSVNDSFNLYTLYAYPPDSRYVPLKQLNWFWAGQANLGGSGWTLSNTAQGWSLGADFPAHPIWNNNNDPNLNGNTSGYVP